MSTPPRTFPASDLFGCRTQPAALFTPPGLSDGHDAAIKHHARLIQSQGVEVDPPGAPTPRGGGRGARRAAGGRRRHCLSRRTRNGHVKILQIAWVDMLRERGAEHIRVFGGGGGTITPEIAGT